MSAQRLLVLGCVRIFQPVHGYDVRRELLTWQVEEWANLSPGSIYSLLKRMDRDGLIEVVTTQQEGNRPARTTYQLTGDGEAAFLGLLRTAWWNVKAQPAELIAAVSFMWALSRDEVARALRHRIATIQGFVDSSEFVIQDLLSGTGTPDHVAEMVRLQTHQHRAEQTWARELLERLAADEYVFRDEDKPFR